MNEIKLTPYSSLQNDSFKDSVITISNKDLEGVLFQDGRATFTIKDCNFNKLRIENTEQISFKDISIFFLDCFFKEIEIKNIETLNLSLLFFNCLIGHAMISSKNINSLTVSNCISRTLFASNQKSVQISFDERNTSDERWEKILTNIQYYKFTEFINQKQSYYLSNFTKLNFVSDEAENESTLYKISKLDVSLSVTYSIVIEDAETKILNSYLNSFQMSGYANGKISVENTKIDNWYLREFSPQSDVTFYRISPLNLLENKKNLEIHKCNLDNVWFDNIHFSEYEIVSFFRSKIGKAIFTSCSFPNTYTSFETFQTLENVHYPQNRPDNYYMDQYETYLQLKLSFDASGNFYESQKLWAISNEALKKLKQIPMQDKIILWFNSFSNNHGLSINRPFILFFLFSIAFYILYLLSLSRIFNSNDFDYKLIGYYFSFIDLTHRTDFLVEKENFNAFSLVIDFISKIVSGYFIYQFISAFRKYGKSK